MASHQPYRKAYRQALTVHPSDKSALTNLASLLLHLGREEESRSYSRKVAYYRDLNPYYYRHRAQMAYQANELEDALADLAEAIRLKPDEHQFYYLRGLVHTRMKKYDLAAEDFRQARDTADKAQLISGYTRKLEALNSALESAY